MLKTFHPLDWAAITKDFAIAVCDKTYSKMPYKLWRELDSVITDYDVSNVRVGWDTRAGCSSITVCFDLANGTTLPPYCFDAKDNSFGSYLYETNLFKEESRNMKVKNYYSDNYLCYSNSNAPLTYLYDTADVEIEATIATKASISDLNKIEDKVDTLAAEVAAAAPCKNTINNNNKENNAMKFNFDFGPVNGSMVRMSLYGLAVKNKAGTWVSYDAKAGDIMDVDILNFDGAKFLYKMPVATKADISALNQVEEKINSLAAEVAAAAPMKNCVSNPYENTTTNNKKENSVMKFNFDFGPVNSSMVRMSLYGLAVKNKAGTWVSYDAKAGDIMDVDILNFDGAKFLYKMPVATKDIAVGDVVIHNGIPMFVIGIATNDAYITAVDPINGERKDIMLPKSPFGFNFATKVVNFLGNLNSGATSDNPFGNLGLMLMLSEDGNGVKDMLPLMLMANGGSVDMSNPLMMYALMSGDGKMGDMLPFMLMMNANKPAAPHVCNCGQHHQ